MQYKGKEYKKIDDAIKEHRIDAKEIKRLVFNDVVLKGEYTYRGITVDIASSRLLNGGIEVLSKAWKDGKRVGFGKDGSVEIERFKIYNPPILIEDATGNVERTFIDPLTKESRVVLFKEDPVAALTDRLVHIVECLLYAGTAHLGSKIIDGKIGNTVSTFSPDASPTTTTFDGWLGARGADNTWNTAHDSGTATWDFSDDSTTIPVTVASNQGGDSMDYLLSRVILLFDTDTLPSTDVISAATLSVFGDSKTTTVNDGDDFITLVQTQGQNISSDTAIADTDYPLVGSAVDDPVEGIDTGERKDITSISTAAFTVFNFNSTGIGWVAKNGQESPTGGTAGITYLGLRNGWDVLDNPYPPATAGTGVSWRSADYSGTSSDPVLTVTHSAIPTASPMMHHMQISGGLM